MHMHNTQHDNIYMYVHTRMYFLGCVAVRARCTIRQKF